MHLICKDVCPVVTIRVIACNHTHPSPTKMFHQLYQGINLNKNRWKSEMYRDIFLLSSQV